MKNTINSLMNMLGDGPRAIVQSYSSRTDIEEIRLRCNNPLIIRAGGGEILTEHVVTSAEIGETLERMAGFSLYSFEDELRNGFITVHGGYRIGICGKAVIERGKVKTIKGIGALNIRVVRSVTGCANGIIRHVMSNGGYAGQSGDEPAGQAVMQPCHTIIVSPPRCGKTTILRDIIRQLSDGVADMGFRGVTVGVVDERSEIAGCYLGVPQHDVGKRTDVLDGCPKAEGMIMLLRAMSPDVIAVDEIGRHEDIYAIDELLNAGVKIICTAHAGSLDELRSRLYISELLERGIFERIILLGRQNGAGTVRGVYDNTFTLLNQ